MIRTAVFWEPGLLGWAVASALANRKSFAVTGHATTFEDLLKLVRSETPNVVLSDVTTLERDGFRPVTALADLAPHARVVALYRKDQEFAAAQAVTAGLSGLVDTAAGPDVLAETLAMVAGGKNVVERNIAELAAAGTNHPSKVLSQRELQVMEMLALGATNREIADELSISVKTVDTHRGHVLKKLRLRNNADLTRFAVRHGMIGC